MILVQSALARAVQQNVPFVPRPFDALAELLGLTAQEVLDGLRRFRREGLLREISAVLDGRALGYDSALVTCSLGEREITRVTDVVNAHPTVTHSCLHNHKYNFWFALTVPQGMGMEQTLSILSLEAGGVAFHPLRQTMTFKIGVTLALDSLQSRSQPSAVTSLSPIRLGALGRSLLCALQTPLPLEERPFSALAQLAGVSEEDLLAFAERHKGGAIRGYVATLRHGELGVRTNGMVVCNVPVHRLQQAGRLFASAAEISHCCARHPISGLPFTLWATVHGPDQQACREVVARLVGEAGITDYRILFSAHDLKKCQLRYFSPELDAWWATRHLGRTA